MTPSVSYRRKPGATVAPDLSSLSLKQIAAAVHADRATLAQAAEEYATRVASGLNPDEPRTSQTSGAAR